MRMLAMRAECSRVVQQSLSNCSGGVFVTRCAVTIVTDSDLRFMDTGASLVHGKTTQWSVRGDWGISPHCRPIIWHPLRVVVSLNNLS